jgi:hypothetical protein
MTKLTNSAEYNEVWTAVQTGLTPKKFRLLPYDEQAELTAYWLVNSRIKAFYADEQTREAKRKQQEMEAKANAQGNRR